MYGFALENRGFGMVSGIAMRPWKCQYEVSRKSLGLGLRVQGLKFRVQGLGFRVQGLGLRVHSNLETEL